MLHEFRGGSASGPCVVLHFYAAHGITDDRGAQALSHACGRGPHSLRGPHRRPYLVACGLSERDERVRGGGVTAELREAFGAHGIKRVLSWRSRRAGSSVTWGSFFRSSRSCKIRPFRRRSTRPRRPCPRGPRSSAARHCRCSKIQSSWTASLRTSTARAWWERRPTNSSATWPQRAASPCARELRFADDATWARWNHPKDLTPINTITLLSQHQPPVKETENRGGKVRYVELTCEDMTVADRLGPQVRACSMDELSPQTRRLLGLIDGLVTECARREGTERSGVRFTQREHREYANPFRTHRRRRTGPNEVAP